MKKNILNMLATITLGLSACQSGEQTKQQDTSTTHESGTFGYDLNFLKERDSLIILKSGDAQIIVSPKYQAKVFTSTAEGEKGKSFGWINYKAFDAALDPHMNGYGGENRFWLGPEGGKYSVFFKKGSEMVYDNWHTPPGYDSEAWTLKSSSDKAASLTKDMQLENYLGTALSIRIDRDITIMENTEIESALGIVMSDQVKAVGFKTINAINNTGTNAWTEASGAPCIWILDMFAPSPSTTIVVPYEQNAEGPVANTNYFGQIPADRVTYANGTLYFKADGKSRGKLGIPPLRAKPVAGSYDAESNVLTVTSFDIDPKATYLNQEWTDKKNPLAGDAVNAYNDGPLEDGGQMGPFYEIESVSPAAFLKPGEKLSHNHSVFHFSGDKNVLDRIAKKVLGASLNEITKAFDKK